MPTPKNIVFKDQNGDIFTASQSAYLRNPGAFAKKHPGATIHMTSPDGQGEWIAADQASNRRYNDNYSLFEIEDGQEYSPGMMPYANVPDPEWAAPTGSTLSEAITHPEKFKKPTNLTPQGQPPKSQPTQGQPANVTGGSAASLRNPGTPSSPAPQPQGQPQPPVSYAETPSRPPTRQDQDIVSIPAKAWRLDPETGDTILPDQSRAAVNINGQEGLTVTPNRTSPASQWADYFNTYAAKEQEALDRYYQQLQQGDMRAAENYAKDRAERMLTGNAPANEQQMLQAAQTIIQQQQQGRTDIAPNALQMAQTITDIDQSTSKLASDQKSEDLIASDVNKILVDAKNRYYTVLQDYSQSSAAPYLANKELDPEKLAANLQDTLTKKGIEYINHNKEKIVSEAERLHLDPEDYAEKVLAKLFSGAQYMLHDELVQQWIPQSRAQALFQNVINNSIVGSLFRISNAPTNVRELQAEATARNQEGEGFQGNVWDSAFSTAGALLLDTGPLSVFGATASGLMKFVPKNYLASATARLAEGSVANRLFAGVLPSVVTGGLHLSQYNAAAYLAQTVANNSDFSLKDMGETAGEGFIMGSTLSFSAKLYTNATFKIGWGLSTSFTQHLANVGKCLVTNIGGKVVETGSFVAADAITGKYRDGIKVTDVIDAAATVVALTVTKNPAESLKAIRYFTSPTPEMLMRFSPDVRRELENEFSTEADSKRYFAKLDEIFKQMQKNTKGKQPEGELGEQLAQAFKDVTDNLSWDAQDALYTIMFGIHAANRPRMARIAYRGDDAYEIDENGNVLSTLRTTDPDERNTWARSKYLQRGIDDMVSEYKNAQENYWNSILQLPEDSPEFADYADEFINAIKKKDIGKNMSDFEIIQQMRDDKSNISKMFKAFILDKGDIFDNNYQAQDFMRLINMPLEDMTPRDIQTRDNLVAFFRQKARETGIPQPEVAMREGEEIALTDSPEQEKALSDRVDQASQALQQWLAANTEIAQLYNLAIKNTSQSPQGQSPEGQSPESQSPEGHVPYAASPSRPSSPISFQKVLDPLSQNAAAYMSLLSQGYTREQLAPLATYIEALASQQGFFAAKQQRVEQRADKLTALLSNTDSPETITSVMTKDGRRFFIKSGNVTLVTNEGHNELTNDGNTRIVTDEAGLLLIDENGNVTMSDGKDLAFESIDVADEFRRRYIADHAPQNPAAAPQPVMSAPQSPTPQSPTPQTAATPESRQNDGTTERNTGTSTPQSTENRNPEIPESRNDAPRNPATPETPSTPPEILVDKDGNQWQVMQPVDGKPTVAPLDNRGVPDIYKRITKEEWEKSYKPTPSSQPAATVPGVSTATVPGGSAAGPTTSSKTLTPRQQRFIDTAIKGAEDEHVLADGTEIEGIYMLAEADTLTPSHDPLKGFGLSEGFPTKDGKTINDRSEYGNSETQAKTRLKADNYDQRAIKDMVFAWKNGNIMSGNDRTMAGILAAHNGTDGKYVDYLKKHAAMFGFTPEQVTKMKHPRVVFVPKEDLPETTETMAKFNKSGQKTQNTLEAAVKASKILRENTRLQSQVGEVISRVENLSDLYQDRKLTKDLMRFLVDAGVVSNEELMEWMDDGLLSPIGKDRFETILLGCALNEESIRTLRDPLNGLGKIRQNIAYAIVPIIQNVKLKNTNRGDYSVIDELQEAIRLLNAAKSEGSKLVDYMLQLDIFEDRAQTTSLTHLMLGEILEAGPRKLKDALNDLNRLLKQASESDSLFGASTKEDILKDVLEQNGYNIDKLRKAYEQRRQATRQATEGAVDGGHPGREDTAGGANGADTGTKDQAPEAPSNPSSVEETEGEVTPDLPKGENPVPHAAVPQPPKPQSSNPPKTSDPALTPSTPAEKEAVNTALSTLDTEIREQEERVRSAKAALEKATAKESGNRDLFGEDDAVTPQNSLFTNSEMGFDNSDQGIVNRTQKQRSDLAKEQQALDDLKSDATRNSRIRAAIANVRNQTHLDFDEGSPAGDNAVEKSAFTKKVSDFVDKVMKYAGRNSYPGQNLLEKSYVKEEKYQSEYDAFRKLAEEAKEKFPEGYQTDHPDSKWEFGEARIYYTDPETGIEYSIRREPPKYKYEKAKYHVVIRQPNTIENRIAAQEQFIAAREKEYAEREERMKNVKGKLLEDMKEENEILASALKYDREVLAQLKEQQKSGNSQISLQKATSPSTNEVPRAEAQPQPSPSSRRSPAVRALRSALERILNRKGLLGDWEEGQDIISRWEELVQMSRKKKSASETVVPGEDSPFKATAVSKTDVAKIENKLEALVKESENLSKRNKKSFMGRLADAIDAKNEGSASKYAVIETKNGEVVTIRLADHNATISNFDHKERDNGISIVISRKPNEGLTNDGDAHVVEFFYSDKALKKAEGNPYSQIARSMQQVLYSGEYKDTTGLAVREEVNAPKFYRTSTGEVYGFAYKGKIYIDPRIAGADTPIHEYTHLWADAMKLANPKTWQRIVGIMEKQTKLWNDIAKQYPELEDKDTLAAEVLAHYSGSKGAERLQKLIDETDTADASLYAQTVAAVHRMQKVLDTFWRAVAEKIGFRFSNAQTVADTILKDLLDENHTLASPATVRRDSVAPEMQEVQKPSTDSPWDKTISFSKVTDKDEIERLEKEPKLTFYRAMLLIDGKLYPPMASKEATGKKSPMREPSKLNQWERSDEHPENAFYEETTDKKTGETKGTWKVKITKDNGDSLTVAYNPYFHASDSMLNDQFASAQDRPQLVVVKCEVPASEMNGDYQAEKALDPTGMKEWKAGTIQSKLTGTRNVMLSRWMKPVEIMKDKDVAEAIKKQMGDDLDEMPTNVVTPALRAELEKLGMKFVPTDNKGVILEGPFKGVTWTVSWKVKNGLKLEPKEKAALKAAGIPYESYQKGTQPSKKSTTLSRLAPIESSKSSKTSEYSENSEYSEKSPSKNSRKASVAKAMGKIFGLDIDIIEDDAKLTGDQARAKGWYDTETGKIAVVLPKNNGIADTVRTILHESVAHHGLRKLFGDNLDTFLQAIYDNAPQEIRDAIRQHYLETTQTLEAPTSRQNEITTSRHHDITTSRNSDTPPSQNPATVSGDFVTATEEYMASIAEDMASPTILWDIARHHFHNMLRKAGIDIGTGITNGDIRYLLWRSAKNLLNEKNANQIDYANLRRSAEAYQDQRARRLFGITPIPDSSVKRAQAMTNLPYPVSAKSSRTDKKRLYSLAPNPYNPVSDAAQKAAYQTATSKKMAAWHLAHVDSLRPLEDLVKALSGKKKTSELLDGHNAYQKALHLSSVVHAQQRDLERHEAKNLVDTLDKTITKVMLANRGATNLNKNLVNRSKASKKDAYDEIKVYSWVKSGLERNRILYVRDMFDAAGKVNPDNPDYLDASPDAKALFNAKMATVPGGSATGPDIAKFCNEAWHEWLKTEEANWQTFRKDLTEQLNLGNITLKEYYQEMDKYIKEMAPKAHKRYSLKDKSGLNQMHDGTYDDDACIQHVMDFEAKIGNDNVKDIWEAVRKVTDFGINKEYDGGLISSTLKDHILNMMEWYVPMRGFDEDTAEDTYSYISNQQREPKAPTIMKAANGRLSMPDDIFAYMLANANSSIFNAESNKVKLALLRLADSTVDYESDNKLLSKAHYWWVKDGLNPDGSDRWVITAPLTDSSMSADEVARTVDDFNLDMRQRSANGDARRATGRIEIPERFTHPAHKTEHAIKMFLAGDEVTLYVNGNPRAAQAINGQLSAKAGEYRAALSKLNRFMAATYTSWSPTFVLRNSFRDLDFAFWNLSSKNGWKYSMAFAKNWAENAFPLKENSIGRLFMKYKKDSLDLSNDKERLFKEFIDNGGRTGYVALYQAEDYKNDLAKALQSSDAKIAAKKVIKWIPKIIMEFNSHAENIARFSAYMTSRQQGRSILRSIADAKDASTNFNRKGAGGQVAKGANTANEKWAAYTNETARHLWLFLNPAIQSLSILKHNFAEHPVRASVGMFAHAALSAVWPTVMGMWIANMFSDEEDTPEAKYENLPEWDRRSGLCFYLGKGKWLKLPLGIEPGAAWEMGQIFASHFLGHEELKNDLNPVLDFASTLTALMPVDPLATNGKSLISLSPNLVAPLVQNTFNTKWSGIPIEKDPAPWNKDYPRYTRAFQSTSSAYVELCRWLTDITNGDGDPDVEKGVIDLSPGQLQNLVRGYAGGLGQVVGDVISIKTDGFTMKGAPVINGLYTESSAETENWRINSRYYSTREKVKDAERMIKDYTKKDEAANGADPTITTRKINLEDKWQETINIWKQADADIKEQREYAKDAATDEERKLCEDSIAQIKKQAVEALDLLTKQKSQKKK